MEVILKPLIKTGWAGVHKYKNCSDYVGSYFTRSGQLYTGLTKEDADRLGALTGLDLRQNSDYWVDFIIRVTTKDIVLNLDDPFDELKYLFLKSHKRVANGFSDQTKPTANYVLINKEVEAAEFNKHGQIKRKAMKEFDKLSLADMRKVLRLYGHKADNLGAELVENKLFELVEKDPQKFFTIWVDNKRRETTFLLQEAIAKNIIRKNKSEYKYGTDTIGYTLEDAITYLDSPEHRDFKGVIQNEVNAK